MAKENKENMLKMKIKEELFSMQDIKYKEFHSKLCPGTNNIIGIRVPLLKKYAKKLAKEDGKDFLDNPGNEYYEEILLQGLLIGTLKMSIEERLKYLEKFIPKIDNWAICDITCSSLKFIKQNKEIMWNFIQKYLKSDKEFEVRFAVIILLDYFIEEQYIDKIFKILDNIKQQDYYVKMAIAWLIQVAYIKQNKKTIEYLDNNKLDNWTYNKALQKIIESNRVNKLEKEKIKSRKR